tara:strand:- start:472 stop:1107 length:636 start_codon:yes stop_codon:yes gene_type:complete
MNFLKRILIVLILSFNFSNVFSQNSLNSLNVISSNIAYFFEKPSQFGVSYERVLDQVRSNDISQFSFKLGVYKILDVEKENQYIYRGVNISNDEAKQFNGFLIEPSFKYYFGWGSPFGTYFSILGSYTNYEEVYTDVVDENNNYNSRYSSYGRGLLVGHQFIIGNSISIELGLGYLVEDINLEISRNQSSPINVKTGNDGIKINTSLGFIF